MFWAGDDGWSIGTILIPIPMSVGWFQKASCQLGAWGVGKFELAASTWWGPLGLVTTLWGTLLLNEPLKVSTWDESRLSYFSATWCDHEIVFNNQISMSTQIQTLQYPAPSYQGFRWLQGIPSLDTEAFQPTVFPGAAGSTARHLLCLWHQQHSQCWPCSCQTMKFVCWSGGSVFLPLLWSKGFGSEKNIWKLKGVEKGPFLIHLQLCSSFGKWWGRTFEKLGRRAATKIQPIEGQ